MNQDHPKKRMLHVGLISDGVRRWAKANDSNLYDAYAKAAKHLEIVIDWIFEDGGDRISVYMLSRDNLARKPDHIKPVLDLQEKFIEQTLPSICSKWKSSVIFAGDLLSLPDSYQQKIARANAKLLGEGYSKRILYLLVAYDPYQEILNAAQKENPIQIKRNLFVPEDIDLIIRTGGGKLLSGFLPMQSVYAEIFFLEKLFNDVNRGDIKSVFQQYWRHPEKLRGK